MVYKFWKQKIKDVDELKSIKKLEALKIDIDLDNELDESIKVYFIRDIEAKVRTLMLRNRQESNIPLPVDEKVTKALANQFIDRDMSQIANEVAIKSFSPEEAEDMKDLVNPYLTDNIDMSNLPVILEESNVATRAKKQSSKTYKM